MIDIEHIRANHLAHGCIILDNPIDHQDCLLDFKGFLMAVDCDKCDPFSVEGIKKPDLLVLRESNDHHEWLVIEIKRQLRKKAWEQVQSGVNVLVAHPNLFGKAKTYRLRVLLAYTYRMRVADINRYRPPIKPDGIAIPLLVRECGGERI